MINIFGVVLFLRTGYLVGNTGVLAALLLVSMVVGFALVTVLSGIGVCRHCGVGSGGVYSMVSTVLGGRVGGTVGLLYVFGQCVAAAMYITGFSESVAELLGLQNQWAVRGVSAAVLLGLLGINLAGVKWIVRLQLLLLAVLVVSTLDFVIGTFTHLDPENGFMGYSFALLNRNTLPDYSPGEDFFTMFGVFFPAATGGTFLRMTAATVARWMTVRLCAGVMSGFNMSSDLRRPEHNIPVGTLAAVFTSWFLYLVFVFLLGAICTREALRYDFLIAEKVSLLGFLFLLGLHVSCLASATAALYAAPRVLQCVARQGVVPALTCLGPGRGPNKTPVAAIILTSLLSMAFIFIGQVNVLAPVVTINFMLTYSFIDYSFFSVTMTSQLQKGDRSNMTTTCRQPGSSRQSGRPLIEGAALDYGSRGESPQSKGTLMEFTKDMDQIFPSVYNGDAGFEKTLRGQRGRETTAKQKLLSSFALGLNSDLSEEDQVNSQKESKLDQTCIPHVGQDPSSGPHSEVPGRKAEQQNEKVEPRPESSYAKFSNHWVALIGALSSLLIMFVIQWVYALANILVALLLFFYIGKASPGLPRGVAAPFSFFAWTNSTLNAICRRRASPRDETVVTPSLSGLGLQTEQLTEENTDFASRRRYHQSSFFRADDMVQPPHE
ncbi:solute carrier family 12 member 8 isoform X2 [Nerophis ophidion]|nr:solute carrier family 12 member 8 isoform X2 [Nerophis ophidion]